MEPSCLRTRKTLEDILTKNEFWEVINKVKLTPKQAQQMLSQFGIKICRWPPFRF